MQEVSFEEEMARLEQVIAEDMYSKKNVHKEIKADIVDGLSSIQALYKNCCGAVNKYMAGNYYPSKNKRIEQIKHMDPEELVLELFIIIMPCNKPVSIQKIVGAFASSFEFPDIFDNVKTAAEIFGSLIGQRLYSVIEAKNSEDGYINIQSNWVLEQKTLDHIQRTRYLNPMLVVPEAWGDNRNGGYITSKNSVILGKNKHHEKQQSLDVLNILQDIEWSLDERILALGETSKKPLNTLDKRESFAQLKRISKTACNEMLNGGNAFYFGWRVDFRGRMYSDGYYINFQSNSYRKAMLEFAEKRLIEG